MATLFGKDTFDVACPACKEVATLTVAWLRSNRRYICDHCATELQIDSEKLLERLADVDRAVDNLRSSIERLKEML